MEDLRISVVLSGGASLGAFEAGATAALLVGVRRVQRDEPRAVVVDAIGGASAGALVAFFASYALLGGHDPVRVLHETWVERFSLDLLRGGRRAALSVRGLRERVPPYLRELDGERDGGQQTPLALHVALTGLQGLTYPIRRVHRDEEFAATTYADWARFVLEPGGGAGQLLQPEGRSPLDAVLASASHPGAFAPALLDRSRDADDYRRHGIADFPDSGTLWYTDGGLVEPKPLGRVLTAARSLEERLGRAGSRALVLVDPRSEGPSGGRVWSDPEHEPGWLGALGRALAILPAQSLYDDARRVEKRNTRRDWANALVDALEGRLDGEAEEALGALLERIGDERSRLPSEEGRPRADEGSVLARVVDEISGLAGQEAVDVNVVSPRLVAEAEGGVPRLLAGEFMGDFGGFLDRDLRHSDFLLGYASAQAWLPRGLADAGLDERRRAAMAEEVEARSPGPWRDANRGGFRPSDLGWDARARLARLGWDALRALVRR